jgi:cation diffusion facilitator family transporter
MAEESKATVIAATTANFAIAAAKLIAGLAGHSAAMLAESVHSAVDGINDLLLLFGLNRSKRPADEQHPFGYGKELYFWALIVSCSVLAMGGGVTIVEGIRSLMKPEPLRGLTWAYAALGCGAAFDAISLVFSLRKFRQQNEGKRFRDAVRETKDPSSLMVIAEDSAAIVGEGIAAAGIALQSHGWRYGDGAASVLIGCLLGAVAIFLIQQNRDLVVGESVEDDISRTIRDIATGDGGFKTVRAAHTMHFGPETVLVTLDAEFDPERKAGELIDAVDRIQKDIREKYPAAKYIYVDPESMREQKQQPAHEEMRKAS